VADNPAITLPLTAFDIASQATLLAVLQALQDLTGKVDALMTEDAAVAAAAADIDTKITAANEMLSSLQALILALQAEVAAGHLSQATLDALAKAQSDTGTFAAALQADVTTDTPPAP
jgi:hypothetical protein